MAIGSMVHYVSSEGIHQAAIVTLIEPAPEQVALFILLPDDPIGFDRVRLVEHDAGMKPGTWHWIEDDLK